MDLSLYINGVLIGFLAASPVGAVAVLCIQKTINRGFLPGLVLGFGSAFGDFVYACIAGFGVSLISDFLVEHRQLLGCCGGILMIVLGYKIFTTSLVKQWKEQKSATYKNRFVNDFLSSFALTISNPLTLIVFGGLFTASGAVTTSGKLSQTVLLLTGVISGALFWWTILVSLVNIFRKKIRLRYIFWINKFTGGFIILFGIVVLIIVLFFIDKLT